MSNVEVYEHFTARLVELCKEYNIILVSDDEYDMEENFAGTSYRFAEKEDLYGGISMNDIQEALNVY